MIALLFVEGGNDNNIVYKENPNRYLHEKSLN